MKKNNIPFVLLLVLIIACVGNENKNPAIAVPGFAGRWELEHMPGYSQSVEVLYAKGRPWLEIDAASGSFHGHILCNDMKGSVNIPDSIRIEFPNTSTTRKACEGDAEAAFQHALAQVQFYHWQHPDSLWLLRANQVIMRLVRVK